MHFFYDLFLLSMKITIAMVVATFKAVVPCRAKNLLGETVLVNRRHIESVNYFAFVINSRLQVLGTVSVVNWLFNYRL